MITRICLSIILLLTAQLAWGADSLPMYSAAKTGQPPVIDGALSDECWRIAEKTASFVAIGGAAVPIETRGMVCRDDENIYIAAECKEPLMDLLKERIAEGKVSPFEEAIEVFIDSDLDPVTYLQLVVNASGNRATCVGNDPDFDLDKEWTAAVRLNNDGWTVEMTIPFRLFKGEPGPTALWGLNLNRTRSIGSGTEWSCWSDTKGGFHSPARFGRLVLQPYSSWLKEYFKGRVDEQMGEARDIISRYPGLVTDGESSLRNMESAYRDFIMEASKDEPTTGDQCVLLNSKGEAMLDRCGGILSDLRLAVVAGEFGRK